MFQSKVSLFRPRALLGTILALTLAGVATRSHAEDNRAPIVPADIQMDEGYTVHFQGHAVGVQIYTWDGSSWGASVPEATLYDTEGNIVAVHYGGPTWESNSGSKVVAAVVLPRVTVDPTAIPWLKLRATHTEGPGIFASTAFIHRVNTVGGKAPSESGSTVGQVARVPYTADYSFYREANY
jgi:hypothetical protein